MFQQTVYLGPASSLDGVSRNPGKLLLDMTGLLSSPKGSRPRDATPISVTAAEVTFAPTKWLSVVSRF